MLSIVRHRCCSKTKFLSVYFYMMLKWVKISPSRRSLEIIDFLAPGPLFFFTLSKFNYYNFTIISPFAQVTIKSNSFYTFKNNIKKLIRLRRSRQAVCLQSSCCCCCCCCCWWCCSCYYYCCCCRRRCCCRCRRTRSTLHVLGMTIVTSRRDSFKISWFNREVDLAVLQKHVGKAKWMWPLIG